MTTLETHCSRFNTDVESTLSLSMKDRPQLSLSMCPKSTTTTSCHRGQQFVPPFWFTDAEQEKNKYMRKCHQR